MANTNQSSLNGYTTAEKVYRISSANGYEVWYVAATPGEAVDAYVSTLSPAQYDAFITEIINVIMVVGTDVITSDSSAGASSGVSATAAAWATTYATATAAGLSGANSSQGTQRLLARFS